MIAREREREEERKSKPVEEDRGGNKRARKVDARDTADFQEVTQTQFARLFSVQAIEYIYTLEL